MTDEEVLGALGDGRLQSLLGGSGVDQDPPVRDAKARLAKMSDTELRAALASGEFDDWLAGDLPQ